MTKIIDPRWPDHKRNVHSDGMKMLMGLDPVKKWPAEGMPGRLVQGVWVYVISLEQANQQRVFHRVRAQCPKCGFSMSAGRLFQHRCRE